MTLIAFVSLRQVRQEARASEVPAAERSGSSGLHLVTALAQIPLSRWGARSGDGKHISSGFSHAAFGLAAHAA